MNQIQYFCIALLLTTINLHCPEYEAPSTELTETNPTNQNPDNKLTEEELFDEKKFRVDTNYTKEKKTNTASGFDPFKLTRRSLQNHFKADAKNSNTGVPLKLDGKQTQDFKDLSTNEQYAIITAWEKTHIEEIRKGLNEIERQERQEYKKEVEPLLAQMKKNEALIYHNEKTIDQLESIPKNERTTPTNNLIKHLQKENAQLAVQTDIQKVLEKIKDNERLIKTLQNRLKPNTPKNQITFIQNQINNLENENKLLNSAIAEAAKNTTKDLNTKVEMLTQKITQEYTQKHNQFLTDHKNKLTAFNSTIGTLVPPVVPPSDPSKQPVTSLQPNNNGIEPTNDDTKNTPKQPKTEKPKTQNKPATNTANATKKPLGQKPIPKMPTVKMPTVTDNIEIFIKALNQYSNEFTINKIIETLMEKYKNSTPTEINSIIDQLNKGAKTISQSRALEELKKLLPKPNH